MGMTPLLSIVIPAYNWGRYVGYAIESVLEQSMKDFELIIVNNGSTDNTDEVVKTYLSDSRVRYLIKEKNTGPLDGLKIGFAEAKSRYVTILCADDFYLPGAFETLAREAAEHPEYDIIYGKYYIVNSDNQITRWLEHPGWNDVVRIQRKSDLADLLQYDLYIAIAAAFIKIDMFRKYPFDEKMRVIDYEFILQLAQDDRKFHFVDRYLYAHRHHSEQLTVGDNFIVDGTQLKDQLTLIERFVQPKNYAKLDGAQEGILRLLNQKITALENFPESAAKILPELSERIGNARKAISEIRHVSDVDIKRVKGPLVSIIVPTFNRPHLIGNTIQSILNQTYPNIEIVIVNDCGSPVEDIVYHLNNKNNIVYLRHSVNAGLAAARNTGIRTARGDYIGYLDDDDIYYPEHVETLVDFIIKNKVQVAYTDACRATQSLVNGIWETKERKVLYSMDFNNDTILIRNMFPVLCILHEKKCIDTVGGFDESLKTHEDWDLWLRMSRKYALHHIKKITAEYVVRRGTSEQMTTNPVSNFNETRKMIYQKYADLIKDRPDIIKEQEAELMNNDPRMFQEQMLSRLTEFIENVSILVEKGDLQGGLKLFDAHRDKFPDLIPELMQIDTVMNKLRLKIK